MDVTNCSRNNESVEEYLLYLDDKSDVETIPALVMLVVFAVVGLVGNILVLVVYSQKVRLNPTKVLIMTIASFDLVANVGAIPTALTTMFDTWNFNRPGLCKLTVFLGSFCSIGGAISLMAVAVVRYRKVCQPYGWQISVRQAIITSILCALLAFIVSIPYIIIYGVRTRHTPCPNIYGHDCFADDNYFDTIWPLVNNLLFILIYIFLSISMVVLYTLIGVTAWKHGKLHGVYAEASANISNVNSISRLSPAATTPVASATESCKTQTGAPSGLTNHLFRHGCMNPLLCCSKHQAPEKTIEDTPSSIALRSHTTTITEKEEKSPETMNPPSKVCKKNPESHLPLTMEDSLKQLSYNTNKTNIDPCLQFQSNVSLIQSQSQRQNCKICDETRESSNLDEISNYEYIKRNSRPQNKDSNLDSSLATSSPLESEKKAKGRLPLGKMTAMLIIITFIFIVGFLPFLILTVYKKQHPEKYANLNRVEMVFYNMFYRLYFLNSVANPVVYSLFDSNFRRHCTQFLKCTQRKYL